MSPTLVRLGVALATAVPMIAAVPGAAAAAPGSDVGTSEIACAGLAASEDPAAHAHGGASHAPASTAAATVPAPATTEDADPAETTDTGHDMAGMSGDEMAGMDDDMAGMDHGEKDETSETEQPGGHQHDESGAGSTGDDHDGGGTAQQRPRVLVLGSFGLVNGAVLLAAAVLRRRDRARPRHRPHVTSAPTTA